MNPFWCWLIFCPRSDEMRDQRRLTNMRTERTVRTWRSHPICLLGVLLYHDMILLLIISLRSDVHWCHNLRCAGCCCESVVTGYMSGRVREREVCRLGGSRHDWVTDSHCQPGWRAGADTQAGDNVIMSPVSSPLNIIIQSMIPNIINACPAYFLSLRRSSYLPLCEIRRSLKPSLIDKNVKLSGFSSFIINFA